LSACTWELIRSAVISFPAKRRIYFKQFDCVVSFQVIEHIKDDATFTSEAFRVLKDGGTLIITTPNISMSLTRNPWHVREYTRSELATLVGKESMTIEMSGVYGRDAVVNYYNQNKKAVEKITRYDILRFQKWLPASFLKIPYDILNRINRNRLQGNNNELIDIIQLEDYFLKEADDFCYDLFLVAKKGLQ
jgi:SAM-dependent methyltransferase